MPSFQLTYLMYRNKLTYLRHALPSLLANVQDGEEVVIIDAPVPMAPRSTLASSTRQERFISS